MILGMTIQAFIHTAISIVAIVAGFPVLAGLLKSQRCEGWTSVFLIMSVATNLTGVVLPAASFLPSHGVAILALLILLFTVPAKYSFDLQGAWRPIYVIGAVISLYLNVFVLIIQLFGKVPSLKALAPTQSEPPFAIVQGIALIAFVVLGFLATRKFHPRPAMMA